MPCQAPRFDAQGFGVTCGDELLRFGLDRLGYRGVAFCWHGMLGPLGCAWEDQPPDAHRSGRDLRQLWPREGSQSQSSIRSVVRSRAWSKATTWIS